MPAIRKVRWLSMEDKVPSGRGEFKPMEIPPVTFEVGSSLRKLGEEVTFNSGLFFVLSYIIIYILIFTANPKIAAKLK